MSRIPPLTPAYAEASVGRPALSHIGERGLIEDKGRGYSGKVGCRFT